MSTTEEQRKDRLNVACAQNYKKWRYESCRFITHLTGFRVAGTVIGLHTRSTAPRANRENDKGEQN